MTIIESIKKWLKENDIIIDEVSTEYLGGYANVALMKSPNNRVETYIDGTEKRTEYLTLYIKCDYDLEEDRNSNDSFFEDLEYKIEELNKEGNLPLLDKKRTCISLSVSGSAFLFQTDENVCIYSLTLVIEYRKE